ncbi:hypothetical protein BT93_E1548 [Corymbia citriodora subsp. variegata]|nr:hypothetical protein BT93_E1548 [Corymbia citriodora subsp. variegata]
MDYERIQKPQGNVGGGLSPRKLRNMLRGVEKKRKEEECLDSLGFDMRSELHNVDDAGGDSSDNCKDVDVVTVLPECSASTMADLEMARDCRLKENSLVHSRFREQEDLPMDYDGVSVSSSVFEFQKAERAQQRLPIAPFSKPAPSKWDDAQKWIASPTSNRTTGGQAKPGTRKAGLLSYGSRQSSLKVVTEVPDQRAGGLGEPDTKRIDMSQASKEGPGSKFVSWQVDMHPIADLYGRSVLMVENSISESAVSLSQHDSVAIHSATTYVPPPSTARSVSMRDMGTEMTPIASQEPSRTGTPVKATTPTRSPDSSRPSTPPRAMPTSSQANSSNNHGNEMSEKELQMKTRKEIVALGTQLGKLNIAAWAGKEDEGKDISNSLKTEAVKPPAKNAIETRAVAWEEAEKAKYIARFKREEMKIQAWENHEQAKTEAEMRKIEVDVERIQGQAHDKLTSKLASLRHKAEEKRAAAEAKRNRQAVKAEEQAEYIRKTGRIPSSFSICSWCC